MGFILPLPLGPGMRRTVVGFVAAAVVLFAFLAAVDPDQVLRLLVGAEPLLFGACFPAVFLSIVCRSEAYRRLFGATGTRLSPRRGFGAYGTSIFVKGIVPLANAAAPAIYAYTYDRVTGLGYDRTLAVSTIAEAVTMVTSIALTLLGVALVAARADGVDVRLVVTLAAILAAGVVAVAAVVLYRRALVGRLAGGVARGVAATLGQVSTRVRRATTPASVDAGVARYYRTIDVVGADRAAVATAAALTMAAWILYATPLYLSALAIGADVGLGVAFVLVPAGGLAAVVPLPGGLGGYEVGVAGGLVLLAGLAPATAAAAVILYRLSAYWFLVVVGGVAAATSATVPRGPEGAPLVEGLDG